MNLKTTTHAIRSTVIRFCIYAFFGIAGEVFFFHIIHHMDALPELSSVLFSFHWQTDPVLTYGSQHFPEPAAMSRVSLWMFFVYGIVATFGLEPAMKKIRYRCPWWIRGAVYGVVVLFFECAVGWILWCITGYRIWFYSDKSAILQFTSLAIYPHWVFFSLLSERVILAVCTAQESGTIPGRSPAGEHVQVSASNMQRPAVAKEAVVVIHGLWLSKWWMQRITRRASRLGYQTYPFEFRTWTEESDQIVDRLSNHMHRIQADRIHVVAHSLGGCFALRSLSQRLPRSLGKVVLIGTPVNGSRLARFACRIGLSTLFLGKQEEICMEPPPHRFARSVEIGTISGTLPIGLGFFLWRPGMPSDGMISVFETRRCEADKHIHVFATHFGLMFASTVLLQIEFFLRTGRFIETSDLQQLYSLR